MDPDGTLDTWIHAPGRRVLRPRAPHHIEDTGPDEWHFAIFFDQPTPADIGYRASASAYSREVLAAPFNTHIDDLPDFPFTAVRPAGRQPQQPTRRSRRRRMTARLDG